LAPGDELTITSPFTAPGQPGQYESTWQLEDVDGNVLGTPITFEIGIYVPTTPTPTVPTPTPTPAVTPTPVETLNFNVSVFDCIYVGSDWRCQMSINVHGGVGPYTVFVFDAAPPVEYRGPGPSFTHFIQSRRCFAWNHEIRVQDDGTGNAMSQNFFLDPDSYFENGCSETDPPG
jgi:hypothetical protein